MIYLKNSYKACTPEKPADDIAAGEIAFATVVFGNEAVGEWCKT